VAASNLGGVDFCSSKVQLGAISLFGQVGLKIKRIGLIMRVLKLGAVLTSFSGL